MIKRLITYNMVGLLNIIFSCFLCFTSCDIDDDMEECTYNVQITYRYNKGNTEKESILSGYIQSITEYIYDGQGILYAMNSLPTSGSTANKKFVSEQNLPPGKYTAISWANTNNLSKVNTAKIGTTKKNEMTLSLNSPYKGTMPELQGSSEKLYYGYRTFSVSEKGVSRIYIDMIRSYYSMGLVIKWKTKAPENTGDFYILYKNVPSEYSFLPGSVLKNGDWDMHDPDMDDYSAVNKEMIHHIADINTKRLVNHRFDAKMNIDKRIETELITYRHKNNSHPLLSIYAGASQIMKEIDLERFFRLMDIELDKNLEQEFNVLIEIDGDNVNIKIANTNDWEEGGIIG